MNLKSAEHRQIGRHQAATVHRQDTTMSKIAVLIVDAIDVRQTLTALRRVDPDTSILELRARIAARAPVLEYMLFRNDYPLVASKLRTIVQALPESGATLRLFEYSDEDSFEAVDQSTHEISMETLNNILRSADEYE